MPSHKRWSALSMLTSVRTMCRIRATRLSEPMRTDTIGTISSAREQERQTKPIRKRLVLSPRATRRLTTLCSSHPVSRRTAIRMAACRVHPEPCLATSPSRARLRTTSSWKAVRTMASSTSKDSTRAKVTASISSARELRQIPELPTST